MTIQDYIVEIVILYQGIGNFTSSSKYCVLCTY